MPSPFVFELNIDNYAEGYKRTQCFIYIDRNRKQFHCSGLCPGEAGSERGSVGRVRVLHQSWSLLAATPAISVCRGRITGLHHCGEKIKKKKMM